MLRYFKVLKLIVQELMLYSGQVCVIQVGKSEPIFLQLNALHIPPSDMRTGKNTPDIFELVLLIATVNDIVATVPVSHRVDIKDEHIALIIRGPVAHST